LILKAALKTPFGAAHYVSLTAVLTATSARKAAETCGGAQKGGGVRSSRACMLPHLTM
jgi:hypothetical protein